MNISPETTVGELAARHPATVKVFRRHKVEFCCGGHRTLAQTCGDARIACEALVEELRQAVEQAPPRLTWADRPLADLVDHIVEAFHDPIRHELPGLQQLSARLREHGDCRSGVPAVLHYELGRFGAGLMAQMRTEETELFPLLVRRTTAQLDRLEQVRLTDRRRELDTFHYDAAATLRLLRRVTGGYHPPANACAVARALYRGLDEFEALMQLHVHLEINVLIPRAAALGRCGTDGHPPDHGY
jgi:regulator of cell morphogenesis and NO signaling